MNKLTPQERRRLSELLLQSGWELRDGALWAPLNSMDLPEDDPWNGSLENFEERMSMRVERIKRNLEVAKEEHRSSIEDALKDSEGLVSVLRQLLKEDV